VHTTAIELGLPHSELLVICQTASSEFTF